MIKFYSDLTKNLYDTAEDCNAAEEKFRAASKEKEDKRKEKESKLKELREKKKELAKELKNTYTAWVETANEIDKIQKETEEIFTYNELSKINSEEINKILKDLRDCDNFYKKIWFY